MVLFTYKATLEQLCEWWLVARQANNERPTAYPCVALFFYA